MTEQRKLELVDLPTQFVITYDELNLPDNYEELYRYSEIESEADLISDYITDKTGFCHNGFSYQLCDKERKVIVDHIDWDID